MFRSHEDEPRPSVPAGLADGYRTERREVDAARGRMIAVTSVRHRPAEARAAAGDLARALSAATATAGRALQTLDAPASSPRRTRRHRKATPVALLATRFWAGELVRLAEIGVWLRRETLDDLGVHVPTTVRVGSRAATGPHIAGLVADPDDLVAATLHQPWIGVDLRAVVDGVAATESA